MTAVGEAAAANHQVAQAGEVGLAGMLVTLADFPHRHRRERHRTVEQCFQRCRHTVAVQRETEKQQVAIKNLFQNLTHVVVVDAGASISFTCEAAGAVLDVSIDDMNERDLLRRSLLHSVKECARDVYGVALLPLGAAVEYEYFHLFYF